MDEFTQSLGTLLRQYRKEHHLSQGYVAEYTLPAVKHQTAMTYISSFELGKRVPDDVLFAIRKFVDVNVLRVGGEPTPPKKEPTIEIKHTYEGKLPKEKEIAPVKLYYELLEWLYLNQDAYDKANDWRKAFIAQLKGGLKI